MTIKLLKYSFIVCIVNLGSMAHGQSCGVVPSNMDCVAATSDKEITAFTQPCQKITNNHSSNKALMIPLRTDIEWSRFLSSPPSGIALSSCAVVPPTPVPFCSSALDNSDATGSCIYQKSWGGGGFICSYIGNYHSYCVGSGNKATDTIGSRVWGGFCQGFGCTWYECSGITTAYTIDFGSCP